MLDQRRRRWADVVEMLYKCFVLAGALMWISNDSRKKNLIYTSQKDQLDSQSETANLRRATAESSIAKEFSLTR